MLIILTALGTGILSGLAVGGGSLLVAVLVLLFGEKQHIAQGAVLVGFLPTALAASLTHLRAGRVDLRLVARLAAGSMVGAYLGARLAGNLPGDTLRGLFGLYLLAIAVYSYFNTSGT